LLQGISPDKESDMSKHSKAGAKRVKRMKRKARRLLKKPAHAASDVGYDLNRMAAWLNGVIRRSRKRWPKEQERIAGAAQRAEAIRDVPLLKSAKQ
jgi:predicted DNA-binding ArsR family transcriptional regulator